MLIKHMLYLQLDVILSCAAWKAKAECDMIFYFSFFYIVKKQRDCTITLPTTHHFRTILRIETLSNEVNGFIDCY